VAYTDAILKKLFALSGNQCAFPGCLVPVVDGDSGIVVAEICHIKGKSPNGPRYDDTQSNEERNGYDNLVVMCAPHNKIVDHPDTRDQYPVERLRQMKEDHEAKFRRKLLDPTGNYLNFSLVNEDHMMSFVNYFRNDGDAHIATFNQSGGQNAYQIINVHPEAPQPSLVLVVESPMNPPQHPSIDLYDFRVRFRNEGKKPVRSFLVEVDVPNAYASSNASSSVAYVPNSPKQGITMYRRSSELFRGFVVYPGETTDYILTLDYQLRHEQYSQVHENIVVSLYYEDELVTTTEYPIADFRNNDRMNQLGL
jgi:hypothetical protein